MGTPNIFADCKPIDANATVEQLEVTMTLFDLNSINFRSINSIINATKAFTKGVWTAPA